MLFYTNFVYFSGSIANVLVITKTICVRYGKSAFASLLEHVWQA